MTDYKYPYVPKEYYTAVIFACKMIRENGYFNKAIKTAANYYGVDADELEKHVRKRQGAGQKGKSRKYFYYVVTYYPSGEDDMKLYEMTPEELLSQCREQTVKATSAANAEHAISNTDRYLTQWNEIVAMKGFEKEKEAKTFHFAKNEILEAIKQKQIDRFGRQTEKRETIWTSEEVQDFLKQLGESVGKQVREKLCTR